MQYMQRNRQYEETYIIYLWTNKFYMYRQPRIIMGARGAIALHYRVMMVVWHVVPQNHLISLSAVSV